MSIFEPSRSMWTARMLSILRIVAGLVFFVTGTMKLFGFPPFPTSGPTNLPMPPMWEFHLAGILETYLGAAFTLGLLTRPISFVLAGEMAFAYFRMHQPRGLWPIQNGGELAVLYCFVFLYLCTAGPGPLSLDRFFRKSAR